MIKRMAGGAAAAINPQCSFAQSIFLLGHMRCGSTALSHILCGHPQVSGYGEAHIRYNRRAALGVLWLNQLRRRAWRPSARHLFDKVLHARYFDDPDPAFYSARAVFLIREPGDTIRSIRKLFGKIGSHEYGTDTLAADYYEQQLAALMRAWARFPAERRIGFSYDRLTGDPEAAVTRIGVMAGLTPPLANRYAPRKALTFHGAGDPLSAHTHTQIVAEPRKAIDPEEIQIRIEQANRLDQIYHEAAAIIV